MKRYLRLDVFDYSKNLICNLYDSNSDISGQAFNVHVKTERNGWKEVHFSIPSVCEGENGPEENYRLKYLVNEYKVRLQDNSGTDWYKISEPKVMHNAFSKNVDVIIGHVSQSLKYKKLDLEFSDEEGNNVGTALALLETILDGTGWHTGKVKKFVEKDGETVKIRSLIANGENGGAFGLIQSMCDLFDAKAVYHAEGTYVENGVEKVGQCVDILPLNPFSQDVSDGEIPAEVMDGASMLEIHYDKNMKGVTRTLNTDNLVTVLNPYGSYGDTKTGMGKIQGAKYNEYTFTVPTPAAIEYKFTEQYGATWYFPCDAQPDDELKWIDLDFTSRMYVLNVTQSTENNVIIYKTYKQAQTEGPVVTLTPVHEEAENQFSFLTDFRYYQEIGLLTDDMLEELAKFQRDMPVQYIKTYNATMQENTLSRALSELGNSGNGFLRLDVEYSGMYGYEKDTLDEDGNTLPDNAGYLRLKFKQSTNYPDGVIYRSDYLEKETKYFSWHVGRSLKPNGDPIREGASWLMIIHEEQGQEPTWNGFYVRNIGQRTHIETQIDGTQKRVYSDYTYSSGEEHPTTVTLFADWNDYDTEGTNPNKIIPHLKNTDKFYLFCTNDILGKMGGIMVGDEATTQTLNNSTDVVTEKHPVFFEDYRKRVNDLPALDYTNVGNSYGWCVSYDYSNGTNDALFFSYPENGDNAWYPCYCQTTEPTAEAGAYYYNTKYKTLYHGEVIEDENHNTSTVWVLWDTVVFKRIANDFGIVLDQSMSRKQSYMGLAEQYIYKHTSNTALPVDNYAIESPYGYYWAFTTDKTVAKNESIWVDTASTHLYQGPVVENIVQTQAKHFDTVIYPSANDAANMTLSEGNIDLTTGKNVDSTNRYRTEYIEVFGGVQYSFGLRAPTQGFIYGTTMCVLFYDSNKEYYGSKSVGQAGYGQTAYIQVNAPEGSLSSTITATPADCGFVRIVTSKPDTIISVSVYDQNSFFVSDGNIAKQYHILSPITEAPEGGIRKGLNSMIAEFSELTDELYLTAIQDKLDAQNEITSMRNNISELLGDMWKEGKWRDESYVEGDEDRLYTDAMDDLNDLAKPDATYDIDFLDLYGSNHDEAYYVDEMTDDVEWPDIHETDAVHLIDPEIDINLWAYIDTLDKCYDKAWETKIEVNTHLTLMAQHSFTDILSNIADVASTVKAKQSLYDRAKNINIDGTMNTSELEGTIDVYRHEILGGQSGWFTNEKGQMVFENADGRSAMMLSGTGLCIANSKDPYGEWNWRTAITGQGIAADAVTTGYLSAERIWAGSITSNKLAANVGDVLDISSNVGLNIYATTDGERPAGGLKTPAASGDSYIQIAAKTLSNEAFVKIASGGEVEINGSNVRVVGNSSVGITGGTVDITGGTVNITAGTNTTGTLNVYSGGTISVSAGITGMSDIINSGVYFGNDGLLIRGTDSLTHDTRWIKAGADGTLEVNGRIVATEGEIAGLTIGSIISGNDIIRYMKTGITDMSDTTHDGVYLGTDGLYIRGTNGNSETSYVKATSGGTVEIRGGTFRTGNWLFDQVSATMTLSFTAPHYYDPSDIVSGTATLVLGALRSEGNEAGLVFEKGNDNTPPSLSIGHYKNGVSMGGVVFGRAVGTGIPTWDDDGTIDYTGSFELYPSTGQARLGNSNNHWNTAYIDYIRDATVVDATLFNGTLRGKLQNISYKTGGAKIWLPSTSYHLMLFGTSTAASSWVGYVLCDGAGSVTTIPINSFGSSVTLTPGTNSLQVTVGSGTWAATLMICMGGDAAEDYDTHTAQTVVSN